MESGELNKRILIEKGVSGITSIGSPKLNYEDYMTTWAKVYVRSSTLNYDLSERLVITTEFTIRLNSKTKSINNKYRIKYNGNYYKIIEPVPYDDDGSLKLITEHYYDE